MSEPVQESFHRNAVGFSKLCCELSPDETKRLQEIYDDKIIEDGISCRAVLTESDDDCLWYRMKLVRDNVKYSAANAKMLHNKQNFVVGMGNKVCFRAVRGLYPVLSVLTAEENFQELVEQLREHKPQRPGQILKILVTTKDMFNAIVGMPLNTIQLMGCLVDLPVQYGKRFTLTKQLPLKLEILPFEERQAKIQPPILIMDDVRSADNVGVLFRSAFSFGIRSAIMTHTSSSALNSRSARVSMGALFHFSFYQTTSMKDVILELINGGVTVYGTTPNTDNIISSHSGPNWALLVGNEADGASDETMSACNRLVKIPQLAGDSLSVSHAAAICLYELHRDVLRASNFTVDPQ